MPNEESPFVVIYDSMLALNLPVKTLLVLALIYGYTRNADGWYTYKSAIAERLRMQPSGVSRALRSLMNRGLVRGIRDIGGPRLETPAETDYSGPFIVVYDWMLDRRLAGRELLVYALIYGFNKSGKGCYGRREWIGKRLNISNPGKVIAILKRRRLVQETYKRDGSPLLAAMLK